MQQHSSGDTERGGKRKSSGKRKLPDQGEPSHPHSQRTISELLSKNPAHASAASNSKRSRFSLSPTRAVAAHPSSPNKMYNFSGSPPSNGAAFLRTSSASNSNAPVANSQASNASGRQNNFAPNAGARKLVVKNLRTGPRGSHEPYFDKTWSQLDSAFSDIFDGRKPTTSLEELYKGAENICRQGRATMLAQKVQDRCKGYVSGKLRENLVARAAGVTDVDTLRAVIDAWSTWHSRLITIRWVFYYLDQSFLLHSREFPVIHQMGLSQFRSLVFADKSLRPKILQGACDLIAAERGEETGNRPDSTLLRAAIDLFHNLDVYNSDFEPLLMDKTREFITSWALQRVGGSLASYVAQSHRLIEREVERCELFSLNRSTKQQLSELLDQILISQQETVLLGEAGIVGLLRDENKLALKQLYGLLSRRGLESKLKNAFSSFIVEQGSNIVFDEKADTDMVTYLLQFKEQLDGILANSFDGDVSLGHTLREAFNRFMNLGKKITSTGGTENPKAGEMIAKYVDQLLKGGWKMTPGQQEGGLADEDAEIDRQLDQVLDLFRFVQGKAVFEAFYKNDLARRLLMGKSASDDAERSMLIRLRKECGSSFTHNLEAMFKDMDVARDEMTAYSSLQRERSRKDRPPVDLNVSVISSAAWPTYPDVPVRIPSSIATSIDDFEKFYHNKHTGRRLNWKHQLAHSQLRAHFTHGPKELVVSAFQAIALLVFNDVADEESLSYTQLKEATGLSDPELQRTLQSLACAKYRVLSKKPKGKEVDLNDEFTFNAGFTDPKFRIKINKIQLKETKEENKVTHERVAADRHFETQAAIVRILKSRKSIKHTELIATVIEATRSRGTLQPAEIKANIDKLVEKEFLERAEGNSYNYVA